MQQEINGILAVDKPSGMSSAGLTARIKRLLGVKKAGHTGTLDPFATGVMLLCLGKATKLARFFLHGIKTYEGVIHLGIETDTHDLTGLITATYNTDSISEDAVFSVFEKFKGTIRQVPPVFSALKHEGVPLYKLARMGMPVQKPARTVHIYDSEILEISLPDIRFRVTCSGGTYIRTLSYDVGKALGCGGHLKILRRTRNSGFNIKETVSLSEIKKIAELEYSDIRKGLSDYLVPMAEALKFMPEYRVEENVAKNILNGISICSEDLNEMTEPGHQMAIKDFEAEKTAEEYIKVVNTGRDLLAVLSREKNQNNYKFCCVFPK
jgi:tRNA pseudouridine55 synthase